MRDTFLVAALAAALTITLAYPFIGLIVWTWLSVQNPHHEAWSYSKNLPLNEVTVIVTLAALAISRESKKFPLQFLTVTLIIFLLWVTLNGFFAYSPDWSWGYWNRTWKIFALGFFLVTLCTNETRVHAIVWIVVLSLFYYGVKGGIFTIATGGHSHVLGPPDTIIGDNNQLALALLMSLPLANYLRIRSRNRWVSGGLFAAMLLTFASIIGSYSRGAMIALAALSVAALLRTRRKFAYIVICLILAISTFLFMPPTFWDRIQTIQQAGQDVSFQGRVTAWNVAFRYACDHFPFGAGFYGPQLPGVFNYYFPGAEPHAAHSIYFQVLGENGFVGLAIYITILFGAFLKCSQILAVSREDPDLSWCADLARMIQLSLVAFCVGGAALSMAYYDVFIICVALLVSIELIATRHKSKSNDGRIKWQPLNSLTNSP